MCSSDLLTGLAGPQTYTASGSLTQAAALASASTIQLLAGGSLQSSAPIQAAGSVLLSSSGGGISTAAELYTSTAASGSQTVDRLGYTVDGSGAATSVYGGTPQTLISGGAISAPQVQISAPQGALSLNGSIVAAPLSGAEIGRAHV